MTVPQASALDQKTNMDYPSEVHSTISANEYPPAYPRPASEALKMAKMISTTLLTLAIILGFVVLMSIYMQTSRGCSCYKASESRDSPYFEPLTSESEQREKKKLPISIQMAGTAGDLMKKMNSKGRVNCVVERKAATQIIASEPKTLITPYGNITTDPRLIHLSGEKMTFTCKGANKDLDKHNEKLNSENHTNETSESRSKRSTKEFEAKSECACDCSC